MRAHIYSILFILFVACVGAASVVVPFSNSHIQYVGRYASTAGGAVFSWSGVTISAKFSGSTSVSAFFTNPNQPVYYYVIVDGLQKAQIHVTTSSSQVEYSLATGLTTGAHTVTLIRRNEALFGYNVFNGFGLSTGGVLVTPDPRPTKRIEFIGDSLTCGYGDLGTLGCEFSAETEDVYLSHGPIAARALAADSMITAWSGDGILRGYGDPNQYPADAIPSFYNLAVAGASQYGNWDFTKWIPQVVVINLGSNDFSDPNQPTQSQFQTAYVNFIASIRTYYASAPPTFFLVCGPSSTDYCAYTQNVATQVGAHFINEWGLATSYGCDYHPTVAGQTNMGNLEAQTIGPILGWPVTTPTSPPTPPPSTQFIYTDSMQGGWFDYSWATRSLTNTAPVHSGTYSISFGLGAWAGLYFAQNSEIYLSAAYHFNFYVNGGSMSGVPLTVTAIDQNGNVVGTAVSIPARVVANAWVLESVAGTAFNAPASTPVYGFIIQYPSASGSGTIYVDDVTLTTGSPSPTQPAVREMLYDDQLRNNWQDWSWGTHSLSNTNPVYAGSTYSISFTLQPWTGIYLNRATPFTLSSYTSFVFHVNGGSLANVPLLVTFADATANTNLTGNSVVPPVAVVAGQWVTESIPVAAFGIPLTTQLSGFIIQFNSATESGVIYLDNIYFA